MRWQTRSPSTQSVLDNCHHCLTELPLAAQVRTVSFLCCDSSGFLVRLLVNCQKNVCSLLKSWPGGLRLRVENRTWLSWKDMSTSNISVPSFWLSLVDSPSAWELVHLFSSEVRTSGNFWREKSTSPWVSAAELKWAFLEEGLLCFWAFPRIEKPPCALRRFSFFCSVGVERQWECLLFWKGVKMQSQFEGKANSLKHFLCKYGYILLGDKEPNCVSCLFCVRHCPGRWYIHHLILIVGTALCSGDYPHLTEKDTEIQRWSVTCLVSHSYYERWILHIGLLTFCPMLFSLSSFYMAWIDDLI